MSTSTETTQSSAIVTTDNGLPLFSSPVPFYGTLIISVACCILLLCCVTWCCVYLCRKKGPKPAKSRIRPGFNPAYDTRSESMQPDLEDLVDGEKEPRPPEYVGKLHYSIDYHLANATLTVTVIEARELIAMDIGGTSDPYVKIKLLPKKKPVHTTRIIKKNCNPLFNETFQFEVNSSEIASRTLTFHVFDHDAIGRDDLIGHATINLGKVDLSRVIDEWQDLEKTGDDQDSEKSPGDVCLSLRYISATGNLTVLVLEAKNLQLTESGDEPDSFVKLTLRLNNKKIKEKKTSVRKAVINPYFNETFNFDVPFEQIKAVVLDVRVYSPGRITSTRLGRVELGLNVSNAPQVLHWQDMLTNARHSIARWHQLQRAEHD